MSDPASPTQSHRLQWSDESISRFWRWQSRFPEQYFTNVFGPGIVRGLVPLLAGGDGTVLDYGCGTGYLTGYLAARGYRVWGTDFSPEAIEATTRRNAGTKGFEGAALVSDLLARGHRFARIVAVEVIEHLDDGKLSSFFAALRQLLAPNGRVIITTPNDERLEELEVYCPLCDHTFHRYQHMRSFSAATLARAVSDAGFQPTRTFGTDFRCGPLWHPVRLARDAARIVRGRAPARPHLVCIAKLA